MTPRAKFRFFVSAALYARDCSVAASLGEFVKNPKSDRSAYEGTTVTLSGVSPCRARIAGAPGRAEPSVVM